MGVRLHIVLPESVHRRAKADAEARGSTLKAYAIAALTHEAEAGALAKPKALDRVPRTPTRRG